MVSTPRAQGLGDAVADVIYWQYKPASTDDAIPPTVEGQLFGLADRIVTIGQMFSIGNAPTGSKDPFALRRAANSIIKILGESQLPLVLSQVIDAYGRGGEQNIQAVAAFLQERLNFFLKDVRGFAYDVVNAVLAAGADDVRDAVARAEAVTAVRESDRLRRSLRRIQTHQEHPPPGRRKRIRNRGASLGFART